MGQGCFFCTLTSTHSSEPDQHELIIIALESGVLMLLRVT
jgi:hypothetical protein